MEQQQVRASLGTRFNNLIINILDEIDYKKIEIVANRLLKSQNVYIYIYRNGVSNVSSLFLFRQLLSLGFTAIYIPDMDLLHTITDGAIIVVSNTGNNDRVNQLLENKTNTLYAITQKESNLDKIADYSITHKIDLSKVSRLEREQQIQLMLLIDSLYQKKELT